MHISEEEYAPFYNGYVKNVNDNVLETLRQQSDNFPDFIRSINENLATHAYGEGKWTVAEVIGHILDTERVMAYRALCFARDRHIAQPGFDENLFADAANYKERTLASLAEEFQLLRKSNMILFESFTEDALLNRGIANGKAISVRALLYVIAGHLIHHCNMLKERYL
ncbi:DinB family protein [Taibaiella lutea]|uniref:DinB family protein n=1 Tax=Taibaiella lutea TaxID=2608001 RepID=A0A5M6CSX4_9BACT|nr:DinB family protein [Taibaiella lutea]KAA5537062.1 DinB family protein [Taibaiella lutea]